MPDKEAVLEEAMDNLREAAQRVKATQARMWSSDLYEHPDCRELCTRLSMALACVEAAYVEARRKIGQGSNRQQTSSER